MKTLCKLCTLCFILMSIVLSSRPTEVFAATLAATSDPAFSENESSLYHSYLPTISYSENGYRSSFRIFNPTESEATITWTAYSEDGSIAMSNADSLPARSSRDYWPMPNGEDIFTGSVVIASDQPISVISTLHSQDGSSIASYSGSAGGTNTVYLPYLLKDVDGYDTWYSVQNAGSIPANITVEYSDALFLQATIPAGASKRFYQNSEDHNTDDLFGTITSDQPIVATIVWTDGTMASAYSGLHHSTTDLSFPFIYSQGHPFGMAIGIRNVGQLNTDIAVTYMPIGDDEQCTSTNSMVPSSPGGFV